MGPLRIPVIAKAYAFEDMPVIAKGEEKAPSIYDLRDIEWKWWKMRAAVGGGPVLMHDGQIRITNKEEQLFINGDNDKHPRTCMGYTRDGRLIILAIQGEVSRYRGRGYACPGGEDIAGSGLL